MLIDRHLAVTFANSFEPKYFEVPEARRVFIFLSKYLKDYNKLPQFEIIINSVDKVESFLEEVNDLTFNLVENNEWLVDEANVYLKDKSLKHAILESVDIIEGKNKRDRADIRKVIEDALVKDLKMDLGQVYWSDLPSRLKDIATSNITRIPTFYPTFDEFVIGGFPQRGSLYCLVGATFSGKSQFAINMACRQVLNGFNVVIYTFELDEYAYAERADSIYSGLDMNRMYVSRESMNQLLKELKEVKTSTDKMGTLIIKDFPTGKATPNDLITHTRELQMRGINPNIIYVDYIGIMKGQHPTAPYLNIKFLAEDLRAMGIMFGCPVVTFHQLNREGRRVSFSDLSGVFVSESTALEHNADFMAIIGFDEDSVVYENTTYFKIVKNRIGGRKGIIPFYVDYCSLKIYDESELDTWLEDSRKSGDSRNLFSKKELK
jgi:hypothetical protein